MAPENDVHNWYDLPHSACPKPKVERKRIAVALSENRAC